MFGSDYPALALDRLVRSADRLKLPEASLSAFLGGTGWLLGLLNDALANRSAQPAADGKLP